MLVEPKIRGFICTTSHPAGCKSNVKQQIDYVKSRSFTDKFAPKKVLVIGSSTGYGLSSLITAAFGYNADTIGVFFEKEPSDKRTASAGWYNTIGFEEEAHKAGLYAKSINGDAFSDSIKQQVIDLINKDWGGKVDLVVYSLASPRRTDPKDGKTYNSVLKPVGATYQDKTVNVMTGEVSPITIEPANDEEIQNTVKVMGGEDWSMWIDALIKSDLLAENCKTMAYSYIGPEMTFPIYRNGTIGKAKEHLERTAKEINNKLQKHCSGNAYVSVNKGLVTQASSAIPVVPLYISILYKIMKEKNIHEGCIEQICRLYTDRLYTNNGDVAVDDEGRIRIDDWEMREDVQQEIAKIWTQVTTDNINNITDIAGYREDFYKLFGFKVADVDYSKEQDINLLIPSIIS